MALPTLNTFTANTKIESSKVNGNFTNLRNRTEVSSSTDHIVITAGTSKLVKITVLRQDDTTNTYTANSVILTGWGFKAGDDATRYVSETVTFGITFSERPIVVVAAGGTKINSDPTHVGDGANLAVTYKANGYAMATTGFTALISTSSYDGSDPGVFGSTARYLYDWIAIGALT